MACPPADQTNHAKFPVYLQDERRRAPTQQCQWQPRLRAERRRWSFASLAMGGKMQEDELYLFAFM